MISISIILLGAIAAVVHYLINFYRHVARYPRGPIPLPIVGNYFQLKAAQIHELIPRLAEKYGPVFTLWTPVPLVILAKYEAVKEAFVTKGDDFAGRPFANYTEDFQFCENAGVIKSNGESWKENRRVAVSIFRDFGMGRALMEEQVKLNIEEYLQYLDAIPDKTNVDLRWPLQVMVANIINETLFGYRYTYENCAPLVEYVEAFQKFLMDLSSSLIRIVALKFPWMQRLPYVSWYVAGRYAETIALLKGYIRSNAERAMKSYNEDAAPECFVHAYAQRMGSSPHLTHPQLLANCADFFLAGQEATTTTLRWAMLYMTAHQDVQAKVRSEILSVVGKDRLLSMADRSRLPYTAASVLEVQRVANVLQLNVLHRTLVDTDVMGHSIPADTYVDGDLHTIHAADPVFVDPEEFRPERYLSEDGATLKKEAVERTIPFSIGKRQCAGEGLAVVELFLGLASTLQHYEILPVDEEPLDLDPIPRMILMPKPSNFRIVPVK